MPGEYEKPITIEAAISNIVARRYLLPSIQRNYTWSSDQIRVLFDSLMRNYPINGLMLWQVNSHEVNESFRFYTFLEKYVERFAETNAYIDTRGHDEFFAVIDGQQRLTSLYVGLKGTYASKLPRLWWPKAYDPQVLPPRRLYLNLAAPVDAGGNDLLMQYDFRFLTDVELAASDAGDYWYQVGDVLAWGPVESDDDVIDQVAEKLDALGLGNDAFARRTLRRLYFAIRRDKVINCYVETSQEIDHVLDIFVRTNQGGTPLSFSDLLMSITTASWEDARERVDELVNQVRTDCGFSVDRNFVMKAALAVLDQDVRFKIKNFGAPTVAEIRAIWPDLQECIKAAFIFASRSGLNDASLRAKNAMIPIVYYLFHKDRDLAAGRRGRFTTINKPIAHGDDRALMRQWLIMSLLRGVFGFAGDSLLSSLRATIRGNMAAPGGFPLQQIIDSYRGSNRDLTFDSEFADRLLKTQKNDPAAFAILALLQPGIDIHQLLHVDHLHPADSFDPKKLAALNELREDPQALAFYSDRENWNGITNLQLLSESENTSKQHKPLKDWLVVQPNHLLDPLIPAGTSVEFGDFQDFIAERSALLKERLSALAGIRSPSAITGPGNSKIEAEH